ncbi:hypothetical protein N602_27345 [Mycobacterium avium subsp. hominissuis 10-5606]|nr:hypothetical protein N602_27345 [Mycobacterium avium subsp. hominissuis 10-5606]
MATRHRRLSEAEEHLLDSAGFTEDAGNRLDEAEAPSADQREPADAEEIPGLGTLLEAIPTSWHPVSVTRFLNTPQPDIAIGESPATPLEWLKHSGGDIAPVLELIEIAKWSAR